MVTVIDNENDDSDIMIRIFSYQPPSFVCIFKGDVRGDLYFFSYLFSA